MVTPSTSHVNSRISLGKGKLGFQRVCDSLPSSRTVTLRASGKGSAADSYISAQKKSINRV